MPHLHLDDSAAWEHKLFMQRRGQQCALGSIILIGKVPQVYKGRWNGVLVAVKALSMGDGMAEEIEREAALLEQLRHPHILKFLGLFSNEDNQAIFLPNKDLLSSESLTLMPASYASST